MRDTVSDHTPENLPHRILAAAEALFLGLLYLADAELARGDRPGARTAVRSSALAEELTDRELSIPACAAGAGDPAGDRGGDVPVDQHGPGVQQEPVPQARLPARRLADRASVRALLTPLWDAGHDVLAFETTENPPNGDCATGS